MIEIADVVVHAGVEHANTTWIAIVGVATFVAGLALGLFASGKRADAKATEELNG